MADAAKNEFGFLPATAYANHAIRDLLWVITDRAGDLAGYLLFGGRFPQLRIFQLHVAIEFRRQGIGQVLVNELKAFCKTNNYQVITARVASELPANHFWRSVDFQIVAQLYQASERRTLNVYSYELVENSLFATSIQQTAEFDYVNSTQLRSPVYALDLNVYFDVVRNRVHAEDVRRILGLSMSGRLKVVVTQEFAAELERTRNVNQPDPLLEFASSIPTLPTIDNTTRDSLVKGIRDHVFPDRSLDGRKSTQDKSDLNHLAMCVHHGISGFVTRENALLKAAREMQRNYGLDVLAPWELVDDEDPPLQIERTFEMGGLEDALAVEHVRGDITQELPEFLIANGAEVDNVRSLVSEGSSVDEKVRVIARLHSKIVGYLCYSRLGIGGDIEAYLSLYEGSHLAQKTLDHFVQLLESALPVSRLVLLSVTCPKKLFFAHETLRSKGYHTIERLHADRRHSNFGKWSYTGPVLKRDWPSFASSYKRVSRIDLPELMPTFDELINTGLFVQNIASGKRFAVALREFETMTSSYLVATERPIVIVPIRLGYANRLLGVVNRQQYLNLPSTEALMLPEKAYFSAASASKRFVPGAIILFYVSGSRGGNQAIVGMARTTFAKKMSVESARTTLQRQGVLEDQDLEAIGNERGDLLAIAFDTYVSFPEEVSFKKLKEIDCVGKANLVTSQPISVSHFEEILALAFGEQ